jgi:hypothetical protein
VVQVLYSDFVALIDARKVRTARLEAGTGRLYFDCVPAATATGAGSAASSERTAGAATAGSMRPASDPSAQTASTAAAAPSLVVPVVSKPALARQYYVKVAEKSDALLVGRILQAGQCAAGRGAAALGWCRPRDP